MSSSGHKLKACVVCGNPAQFVCGQCRSATYCSPKCQTSHWTDHQKLCPELADKAAQKRAAKAEKREKVEKEKGEKDDKEKTKPPLNCEECGKLGALYICTNCRAVHYCNTVCQAKHWPKHQESCDAIARTLRAHKQHTESVKRAIATSSDEEDIKKPEPEPKQPTKEELRRKRLQEEVERTKQTLRERGSNVDDPEGKDKEKEEKEKKEKEEKERLEKEEKEKRERQEREEKEKHEREEKEKRDREEREEKEKRERQEREEKEKRERQEREEKEKRERQEREEKEKREREEREDREKRERQEREEKEKRDREEKERERQEREEKEKHEREERERRERERLEWEKERERSDQERALRDREEKERLRQELEEKERRAHEVEQRLRKEMEEKESLRRDHDEKERLRREKDERDFEISRLMLENERLQREKDERDREIARENERLRKLEEENQRLAQSQAAAQQQELQAAWSNFQREMQIERERMLETMRQEFEKRDSRSSHTGTDRASNRLNDSEVTRQALEQLERHHKQRQQQENRSGNHHGEIAHSHYHHHPGHGGDGGSDNEEESESEKLQSAEFEKLRIEEDRKRVRSLNSFQLPEDDVVVVPPANDSMDNEDSFGPDDDIDPDLAKLYVYNRATIPSINGIPLSTLQARINGAGPGGSAASSNQSSPSGTTVSRGRRASIEKPTESYMRRTAKQSSPSPSRDLLEEDLAKRPISPRDVVKTAPWFARNSTGSADLANANTNQRGAAQSRVLAAGAKPHKKSKRHLSASAAVHASGAAGGGGGGGALALLGSLTPGGKVKSKKKKKKSSSVSPKSSPKSATGSGSPVPVRTVRLSTPPWNSSTDTKPIIVKSSPRSLSQGNTSRSSLAGAPLLREPVTEVSKELLASHAHVLASLRAKLKEIAGLVRDERSYVVKGGPRVEEKDSETIQWLGDMWDNLVSMEKKLVQHYEELKSIDATQQIHQAQLMMQAAHQKSAVVSQKQNLIYKIKDINRERIKLENKEMNLRLGMARPKVVTK